MKAGGLEGGRDHAVVPRLNGPGCPGSNGGSAARRLMIDMGIELN